MKISDLFEGPRDDIRDFSSSFNDPKINKNIQGQAARKNPRWKSTLVKMMAGHNFSLIGAGINGAVFGNPKYPFVLKVYRTDRGYEEWLYFSRTHQNNPHVPILKGSGMRLNGVFSMVRIEKLQPCGSHEVADEFLHPIEMAMSGIYRDTRDLIARDPAAGEIAKFLRDWEPVTDLTSHNVMMRPNGELVLIDPIYIEDEANLDW